MASFGSHRPTALGDIASCWIRPFVGALAQPFISGYWDHCGQHRRVVGYAHVDGRRTVYIPLPSVRTLPPGVIQNVRQALACNVAPKM